VWGPTLGAGGVELVSQTESTQRTAIAARLAAASAGASQTTSSPTPPNGGHVDKEKAVESVAGLDRDMQNIDLSSPIMLSQQAKEVISRLRRMKDEAEDWIK
jgi:hypothetical protein